MNAIPHARATRHGSPTRGYEGLPAPRSTVPAWAGIVGPLLFTAAFLAQQALRRSDYDPIAEPVSALEAGPNGWIQQVNFVVFGMLTLAFVVGLHRGLRGTRAGLAGPAALGVSGVGLLLAAVFPLQKDATGEIYDPGGHTVASVMFFATSAIGLIIVSRRLVRDPRWRDLSRYALAAGIVALIGFVVTGTLVVPEGAALHAWAGLVQQVLILGVVFPARIALSYRLLQVTRAARVAS